MDDKLPYSEFIMRTPTNELKFTRLFRPNGSLGVSLVACLFWLLSVFCANQTNAQDSINGVSMDSLVHSLNDKQGRHHRTNAMTDIARYAHRPGDYLQSYLDGLKDDDEIVRATAAQSLGIIGSRFPSLVSDFLTPLTNALDDSQTVVVNATIFALSETGAAARKSLLPIVKLSQESTNQETRELALTAATEITAGSKDQIEYILPAIKHCSYIKREWLQVIAKPNPDPRVVPALVEKLLQLSKDPENQANSIHTQAMILRCMARIGPDSSDARDEILKIVRQPVIYTERYSNDGPGLMAAEPLNLELRIWATVALTSISPESRTEAIESLEKQLKSEDPMLRLSSLMALDRVSNLAEVKDVLGTIKQLKADPEKTIQRIARLTEIRIQTAPEGSNYHTQYVYLDAPSIEERLPSRDMLIESLKSKLSAIADANESGDYLELMGDLLDPAQLERMLIQNTSQTYDPRQRAKHMGELARLFKSIDAADLRVELNENRATVKSEFGELPFVRFDGQWYVDD